MCSLQNMLEISQNALVYCIPFSLRLSYIIFQLCKPEWTSYDQKLYGIFFLPKIFIFFISQPSNYKDLYNCFSLVSIKLNKCVIKFQEHVSVLKDKGNEELYDRLESDYPTEDEDSEVDVLFDILFIYENSMFLWALLQLQRLGLKSVYNSVYETAACAVLLFY